MKLEIKKCTDQLTGYYYYYIQKNNVMVSRSQTISLPKAEEYFQHIKANKSIDEIVETIKSEEI